MKPTFAQLAVALAVLVAAVFGQTCAHDFVHFDDPQTIATNRAFDPPTFRSVLGYWTRSEQNLYIPVTYNVWGALAALAHVDRADEMGSRLNPWIFHAANVAIHLASALLVLAILVRLGAGPVPAWIAAAVFAVHPVQVETVAWASGTKDLLCGAFGFAAIYFLLRSRQQPNGRWIVAGTAALLLALLSKPTAVVVPLIAITIDVLALCTPWRRSIATLWPWLLIVVPFIVIGRLVQPPVARDLPPLWIRPLVAADALAFYIWKLFWPINLGLDYGRTPARAMQHGWLYFTWIAPAAIAIVAYLVRRGAPLIVAGALIVVIGVLPVLGFVPFTFQSISTVADHYPYLSMLGVAMIIAAVVARFDSTGLRIASAALIVVLAIRAFDQAGTWHDSGTLFRQALSVNPRSAMSRTNLALHLYQHGDVTIAVEELEQAVIDDPDYGFAHFNLAQLLARLGRIDEAEREYREYFRVLATQRNYDPTLAAEAQARIEAQLQMLRGSSTNPSTAPG
jgi:hypothetical protein